MSGCNFRKTEKKLANVERKLSRKKKGSHNRGKAKAKVAKVHAKIANQRRDFLHKASAQIVKNHDVIIMENLTIKNMIRNHKLAKSIQDAGWGKFGDYIEYKSLRQGKRHVLVDPKGTSQTCLCGAHVPKDLSVRLHECPVCGLEMDRDLVSAKLILERGLSAMA
ncbi:Transposase IS605, OrfB, C-terminal [Acididesulfobacillus acetoxydans]|uniref:Transposase IS605, OrfB, C-terminal n=1 Tax=Acididesulfobacillus acetoxydans TaxID=1561005 RepID=A0A8S0WYB3_9FIRM|nr:transposase [Acididesulfobacillus acetoxydans]CAA7601381.1 Transposase IS605, OrfB, C-terminal [Acididesulfobacillus acetoxydans]CEJ07458.1 Transposase, IS605 OrfB [Acididesulfobacillus acetoxydans]